MNKDILISIRPQWVEKIFHKIGEIDGKPIYKKEIEVRKDKPMQVQVPFKCLIYETYDKKYDGIGVCWEKDNTFEHACKKVIGEFICDRLYEFTYNHNVGEYNIGGDSLKRTCLTYDELKNYGKGKDLYGWHISDLKIYDKPKALYEFWLEDKCPYATIKGCTYKLYCFRAGEDNHKNGRCGKLLPRPPQSWCYVEQEK